MKTIPLAAAAMWQEFTFGGAIRARYDWRFNDVSLGGQRKAPEHLDFDTLTLKAAYDSDTLFGAAPYRFYAVEPTARADRGREFCEALWGLSSLERIGAFCVFSSLMREGRC